MNSDTAVGGAFATTAWTQIIAAQGCGADAGRRAACLEHLAAVYWTPVFAFVRCRSPNDDAALELTQDYFATFLEKNFLDQAHREKGRFRAFLLTSVKHFLLNRADHAKAARRAPEGRMLSLNIDPDSARAITLQLAAREESPDAAFMREWAHAAVSDARKRLRDASADYARAFERSAEFSDESYEASAQALGWSVEKVRKTLFRARKKFAELLRAVVRESVDSDDEVEDELRDLRKYFS